MESTDAACGIVMDRAVGNRCGCCLIKGDTGARCCAENVGTADLYRVTVVEAQRAITVIFKDAVDNLDKGFTVK